MKAIHPLLLPAALIGCLVSAPAWAASAAASAPAQPKAYSSDPAYDAAAAARRAAADKAKDEQPHGWRERDAVAAGAQGLQQLRQQELDNVSTRVRDAQRQADQAGIDAAKAAAKVAQATQDQAAARQALQDGKTLPLSRILDIVAAKYPGQVLQVNLRGSGGVIVYAIDVLDAAGHERQVRVDAASGQIVGVEAG